MRKCIVYFMIISGICLYADDGIINQRDDIEFAKTLVRNGYYDQAEAMRQLIRTKGSRQQRKETELLRCLFIKEKAQREIDPSQKKQIYKEAIQCYEGRLSAVGGVQNAKLKMELADLMVTQAQEIIEEARQKNEKIEDVKEILANAEQRFREIKSNYNDAGIDLESSSTDVREKANLRYHSWYGLCRVYYFQGLNGEKGKLELSSQELEEFMGDYEGLIGSYYAMLLNGLILNEKESYSEAIIYYDGVFLPLKNVDHPKARELSIQACYYQIQTYIKWKRFSKAVQIGTKFEKHMISNFNLKLEKEYYGQALLLEVGKAHVSMGEYSKALKIAEKVAALQTYWGFVAKRLLLEWGKLSPTALQNAKNAHLVATGLYAKEKYHEAILAYLKVVKYASSKKDIKLYALDSWEKMGQMYWQLGLYQESAVCYENCMKSSRGGKWEKIITKNVNGKTVSQEIPVAAKATYWAYRGYKQSYKISKDRNDDRKSDSMRRLLVSRFSNSTYAKNPSYDAALETEQKALRIKNFIKAAQQYEKAAEAYRNVSPEANYYERALVRVGRSYYNAARKIEQRDKTILKTPKPRAKSFYQKAVSKLEEYHRFTKNNRLSDLEVDKKARRKEALAESLYYLGRSYLRLGKLNQGTRYLERLSEEYPEQGDLLSKATYLLIKSNLDAGKLEKAEQFIVRTEKIYGADGGKVNTARSSSYYQIGKKYYDKAISAEKKYKQISIEEPEQQQIDMLKDKMITNYSKACEYFYKWYLYNANMKLDALNWIASTQVITAKLYKERRKRTEANKLFDKALRLFSKCIKKNEDPEKEKEFQEKIAECSIETGNWEEAIYVFFPIFAKNREENRKEDGTTTVDPLYLDYLSRILLGLMQQTSFGDVDKLHSFLQSYFNKELMNDLAKYKIKEVGEEVMFDEYLRIRRIIARINSSAISDGEKQEIRAEFEQSKTQLASMTDEERLRQGIDRLHVKYYNLYAKTVAEKLPVDSKENVANANERIKNMSIYLAYDYTSKLLDRLSPYKNPRVRFGNYDNPQWWETKHRQLLIVYLRGENQKAKNLIKSLRLRQRRMGGPEFQKKFNELEQRP